MSTGRGRVDHCALFELMPFQRPGATLHDLMSAATLEEDALGTCQNCLQRWKKWGAIRMVDKRAGVGLWIRVWTPAQFKQWLDEGPIRQRAGRPVAARLQRMGVRPDYASACAQVRSLGSMCEALQEEQ